MSRRFVTPWSPALAAVLALLAGIPAGSAHAQPSNGPVIQRNTSFLKSPGPLHGFYAFKPGSVEIEVQGSPGLQVSIKSVANITLPGGRKVSELFEIADALPAGGLAVMSGKTAPAATTTSATTASSSGGSQISGVAVSNIPSELSLKRDEQISTLVTVKKRLVYKGLDRNAFAHPDTFFRAFDLEIQGTRQGTDAVVRKTRMVLTNDDAPPVIVSASSEASTRPNTLSDDDFPSVFSTGPDVKKTYTLNHVKLHSDVTLSVTDFTLDRANPSQAFKDVYKVVVEYDDGAKFAYDFESLGPSGLPGGLRIKAKVPNIGRGGYKVSLRTPFGNGTGGAHHDFSSNLFVTNIPIAFGSINVVDVDTPLGVPTEDDFWTPATFENPQMPSSRTCGNLYGEWDSVTLGSVSKEPIGVASAKITKNPTKGSLAHNGNMPKFSGSSVGLGTVYARWTAKIRMYVGECADRRLQD